MRDVFDLPPERDLPGDRLDAIREHLMEEISRTESPRRPRLRVGLPRKAVPAFVAATLILTTALAAGAYVLHRSATELLSIGCYEEVSLEADTTVVADRQADPTVTCASIWKEAFGQDQPPSLVACVLESGAVGVFPGTEDTCSSLGLALLDKDQYQQEQPSLVKLKDALERRFQAADCLTEDKARDIVNEELRRAGLTDWTVETVNDSAGTQGPSSSRSCTSLGFNTESKSVLLTPVVSTN